MKRRSWGLLLVAAALVIPITVIGQDSECTCDADVEDQLFQGEVVQEDETSSCKLTALYICNNRRGTFRLNGNTGEAWFEYQGTIYHRHLKYVRCVSIDGKKCAVYETDSPAGHTPKLRSFDFQLDRNPNGQYPIYWSWLRVGVPAFKYCDATRYRVTDEEAAK